ncbi:MAG: family 1 glycosylhydrolase [Taibaiella sp.]|nr:family 1 glycosylhydrolase [Taibaiella sp.]
MKSPFTSFWMAGFECSDQLNCFGDRVDLLAATGHIDHIEKDYQLLEDFKITTVREGVQWSRVERQPYCYDWSRVKKTIQAAGKKNIQVLWDLCHFGYPDDLSPLHPHFCKRFIAFAQAFVHMYRSICPYGNLILTPVNEVNFISWLGGEAGATSPYTQKYGWQVKYNLMQAYIEAVKAMKDLDNNIIILTTEPLINIIPEDVNDTTIAAARRKNEEQFQMLDILCGYICPELGGSPDLVDIVGCNYYHNNQWLFPSEKHLDWRYASGIKGYKNLSELCREVAERYGRPIVIAETSYEGADKNLWMHMITEECKKNNEAGHRIMGCLHLSCAQSPGLGFP